MTPAHEHGRLAATLAQLPGFVRLTDGERAVIVGEAQLRRFAPGQIMLPAGGVPEIMFAVVDGQAYEGASAAPALFDVPGLLFGRPSRLDYRAGPSGVAALAIMRQHLFTIARECPDFIVGLLTDAGGRP